MMKKRRVVSLLLIGIMLASTLTGCGESKNSTGETLNIFVWTEYVPDSVIEKFEDETGIKVNVSTYSSNEDMLAKVKAESDGTYDIVQPSDYMVKQMADQDMLAELAGTTVVLDDYRAVIGITSRSMGLSMNESDPDKLAEVSDKLMGLKENIKLYDSDSPKSALISGDCTVAFCWSAEIALAMEENPDIEIVFQDEGAYLFMDNWCVTKGSKNYDAAMKFINFMLDPEVDQMVLEEFPYLSPNTVAVEAMGEEFTSNPAKNPPEEVVKKGEYVDNLDADTLAIYDTMWTKLKE